MPDNFVGAGFKEDGSQLKGWRLMFNLPHVVYSLRKYSWKNVKNVYEDKRESSPSVFCECYAK